VSLIDDWNKTINTFAANGNHSDKQQSNQNHVAHFCEHRDIRIFFTPARETWLAHIPSGIKPWWLFLSPLLNKDQKERQKQNKDNKNITITDEPAHGVGIEVTENA